MKNKRQQTAGDLLVLRQLQEIPVQGEVHEAANCQHYSDDGQVALEVRRL